MERRPVYLDAPRKSESVEAMWLVRPSTSIRLVDAQPPDRDPIGRDGVYGLGFAVTMRTSKGAQAAKKLRKQGRRPGRRQGSGVAEAVGEIAGLCSH